MRFSMNASSGASKYGLLLDIDSGSVGAAIVTSPHAPEDSIILWSSREELPLRAQVAFDQASKDLAKGIENVCKKSGVEGVRVLSSSDAHARIDTILVRIAAPWAFTVTKSAHAKHTEDFSVTPDLLHVLEKRAIDEARDACAHTDNEPLNALAMIAYETVGVTINGYRMRGSELGKAATVGLTELIEFTFHDLVQTIEDTVSRTFPAARVALHTAMGTYATALASLHLHVSDASLLIIGGEATELGIVRNGMLQHTTYTPYGMRTLARELRDNCAMSLDDALTYMRTTEILHDAKQDMIDEVLELYETNLVELLERTGDSLLLPKTIFMQTEPGVASFFRERLTRAAKRITGSAPTVHPITPQHFGGTEMDTGFLLGSRAFREETAKNMVA